MQFKTELWGHDGRHERVAEVKQDGSSDPRNKIIAKAGIHEPTGSTSQAVLDSGLCVILVVEDPHAALACLNSILHAKTPGIGRKIRSQKDSKISEFQLIVVLNNADVFALEIFSAMEQRHEFDLLLGQSGGFLDGLQVGLGNAQADWVVVISQHTQVFDGWLNKMLEVADSTCSMVSALSNRLVEMPAGVSASLMAHSFANTVHTRGREIAYPNPICLLLNRNVLVNCNGFDVPYYSPGGGEFLEFYHRAIQKGYVAKLAEGCWVFDSKASYRTAAWEPNSRFGFYRFLTRFGNEALELHQAKQSAWDTAQKEIVRAFQLVSTGKREVVFVFREAVVCGLVLAITHICNGLNDSGLFNAYFVCTRLEPPDRKMLPMNFQPVVAESAVMVGRYLNALRNAIVVGTLWNTVEDIQKASLDSSCKKVYFVQDDERRFKNNQGNPVVEASVVEAAWKAFPHVVVNSKWVQKTMKKVGVEAKRIGIGVDTTLFHPREKEFQPGLSNVPLRVMAHCRPSTPRRGWDFIAALINRAAASRNFEFITYDECPTDLGKHVRHHHLGRLSPSELAEQMGVVDIFVEGSDVQGWGMQSLEALSCGVSLISTDNYGIHEFGTAGFNCILTPHGLYEHAATLLCYLIDHPEIRSTLAERARRVALSFDWSAVYRVWVEYLKHL